MPFFPADPARSRGRPLGRRLRWACGNRWHFHPGHATARRLGASIPRCPRSAPPA